MAGPALRVRPDEDRLDDLAAQIALHLSCLRSATAVDLGLDAGSTSTDDDAWSRKASSTSATAGADAETAGGAGAVSGTRRDTMFSREATGNSVGICEEEEEEGVREKTNEREEAENWRKQDEENGYQDVGIEEREEEGEERVGEKNEEENTGAARGKAHGADSSVEEERF